MASEGLESKLPGQSRMRAALGTSRPWRLVFGTSLLVGVIQIVLIRELSAYHALSSVDLSICLVITVAIAAYGLSAALSPAVRRIGERHAFAALGGATALYLIGLLAAALLWLEPQLAARAVDAPQVLLLGVLVSPPFVACGMLVAHVTAVIQRRPPECLGVFIAVSLVGAIAGIVLSHH